MASGWWRRFRQKSYGITEQRPPEFKTGSDGAYPTLLVIYGKNQESRKRYLLPRGALTNGPQTLINTIKACVPEYDWDDPVSEDPSPGQVTSTEIEYFLKSEFSGWGLGDCLIETKDGKQVMYYGDDSPMEVQEKYHIDRTTTKNFKFGTWYWDIIDLKLCADALQMPLFIERGSKGCGPCIQFEETVFNDMEFQEWVHGKNILFGRYFSKGGTDPVDQFIN